MNNALNNLNDGFRLRDCEVHPKRNVVVNSSGEQHMEPKAMQVLVVLATHVGEVVTRESLLEEVWPKTYSGDAALTRCVSLLRAALGEGRDKGRFIETVSKTGYRLTTEVVELDNDSLRESIDMSTSASAPRSIAWIVVGIVVITLAAWLWKSSHPAIEPDGPKAASDINSSSVANAHAIAVLPFANMSGDPANEYFSDGIAEEILNVLAQMPSLRVTSRSSSFAFRDSDMPLTGVAEQLGVNIVLEGSVRKEEDRVRISVQLIDAGNDVMLWSATYDRAFYDLFAVQEEIALSVADTLKIALDINETETFKSQQRLAPRNPEAHEAYLRGRYLMAKRTRRALEDATGAFEQALTLEPEYTEAMAQLAITYLLLTRRNYGNLTEAEALEYSKGHVEEAMRLAPENAESQAAAGMLQWRLGQSNAAEEHFLLALEINPNFAMVHHWLSMLQDRNLGKYEASLESSKMARKLDPVAIPSLSIHFTMLLIRGLFDQAVEELEKLKSISPATYHRIRAYYEGLDGAWANFVLANLDALKADPQTSRANLPIKSGLALLGLENEVEAFGPVTRSSTLRYLGRTEEAVRMAEENLRQDTQSVWAQRSFARALVANGEIVRAASLLEELWDRSNHHVSLISPHFFTLRDILALYQVRILEGDTSGAGELLRAIHTEVENARAAGIKVTRRLSSLDFSEGIALYLEGSQAEGLRLIRKAVEDGYYLRGRDQGFYLGNLSEDPRFAPIMQIHQATKAREKARLLAVVCENNPYQSLWRPATETCAQRE